MSSLFNIKKSIKNNTIFIALIVVMLFFQVLITATGNGSLCSWQRHEHHQPERLCCRSCHRYAVLYLDWW